MSVTAMTEIQSNLINSSSLTALVASSNIKIGWVKELDSFPCIILQQSTGVDWGYLGYNTSAAGSKTRREQFTIQVDIYSRTTSKNVTEIADIIVPIMISSGCRKNVDTDDYNDELSVHRKLQTYTLTKFHSD